jgi:hypothetical protein
VLSLLSWLSLLLALLSLLSLLPLLPWMDHNHSNVPIEIQIGVCGGCLQVWDTSLDGEDRLLGTSAIDDYYHREPVVEVSWVYDTGSQVWNIVSISGEGKVLFWSIGNQCVHPIHGNVLETIIV